MGATVTNNSDMVAENGSIDHVTYQMKKFNVSAGLKLASATCKFDYAEEGQTRGENIINSDKLVLNPVMRLLPQYLHQV